MRYRYVTGDVFTQRAFGGNPLAVFSDAQGLDARSMQLIAREFNYSETVFVLPATDARYTRRLRIFTPRKEIPFAGHPTVGTAHLLIEIGEIRRGTERVVFEEGVGPVEVRLRYQGERPAFAQLSAAQLPEFGLLLPSADALAAMLSLRCGEVVDRPAPQVVSCGYPFLCVAVRDREALARARLRVDVWQDAGSRQAATDLYLFVPPAPDVDVIHARAFVPSAGVEEDPATGSAAAALAGYLAREHSVRSGTLRWRVEQGREMGRPSVIETEVDKQEGVIAAVRVGGSTIMVSEGCMEVPPRCGD